MKRKTRQARQPAPWRVLVSIGLVAALGACALPDAGRPAQPEVASANVSKQAVRGQHFMAVTANPHATEAAVQILREGGSATDAAIAAQFVLNVVEPQSSGVGGGGFLLAFDASSQGVHAYDGRETAPATAREDRFLDSLSRPRRFHDVAVGGGSVGVPGLVAMLRMAHQRHGRLAWKRLLEPAVTKAEEGFAVSARLHALLAHDAYLKADEGARALFYGAEGAALPVGTLLKNPALAVVLRQIADDGGESLYRGRIARRVVDAVQAHTRNPGDLSAADLAVYRSVERAPLCGNYRGYRVCGMPPPSSGGLALLQVLGLLEALPFAESKPMSEQAVHWFSEVGRLVFADRARYLGDPDFVAVPVDALLAPAYLKARAALLRPQASLGFAVAGEFPQIEMRPHSQALEHMSTTHVSIVDAQGNAVAVTSSIEDAFGSRILVDGFLLNNQLTDFAFSPRAEGLAAANRVAPGKRPLSSMSPTLVFYPDGRLYAVVGSPGGSRIINYVAQAVVALIDWKLAPDKVVALPHFGSRNGPTELEAGTSLLTMATGLAARGHRISVGEMTSGLHLIVRDGRGWAGAADPRREGQAAGG